MKRQVYTLGGLLLVALVLSYFSWTGDTPTSSGRITLVGAGEESFESLRWITPESTVEIAAREDRLGPWFEVSVTTMEEVKQPISQEPEAAESEQPDGDGEDAREPSAEDEGEAEVADNSVEQDSEAGGEVPSAGGEAEAEGREPVQATGAGAQEPSPEYQAEESAGDDAGGANEGESDGDEPAESETLAAESEDEEPSATPELREKIVTFTGGLQARRVVEAATPLIATRKLPEVSPERLEAMGLEGTQSRLELSAGGKTHVFELGGRTYGGGHQYLRRAGTSEVYLIEAGPFRPVEHGARRLMRRDPIGMRRNQIEKVSVESVDGRRVDMVHQGRDSQGPRSFFANADEPDRRVEEYGNWIGKVLALRVFDYVPAEDVPLEMEPVLLLAFEGEGSLGRVEVEIHRLTGEDGEESWYARSDYTRAVVSLPRSAAGSIVADLDGILPSAPSEETVENR
ncbi:MAG: DUF4340 domain-containing protein [Myxococcota bacterium]